jgi:hypothetical protein
VFIFFKSLLYYKFYCEPLFQLCSGIVTLLQNNCKAK